MASHGSSGGAAPTTAISDAAVAPSTLVCAPRAARAGGPSRLLPENREKIGNFCEQSCKINILCLDKDAAVTPQQGPFDRDLTPAGRELAAERPPFSQALYAAILAPGWRRLTARSACRRPAGGGRCRPRRAGPPRFP